MTRWLQTGRQRVALDGQAQKKCGKTARSNMFNPLLGACGLLRNATRRHPLVELWS